MKNKSTFLYALLFWGFFAVKYVGTSFALWSWWWLLLPLVPWLGLAVQRLGL
jgi:1,4-dihydroxy-2-naphthoate octaprenyltransferase